MSGLRRHIPAIAIDWAIDTPERRWRVVEGTLCLADISGFTALAERLALRGRVGGEELVETLSRVFGAMLDRAEERDGMLLKFGGDALLFLFQGEDHAVRATSAALEMRRALRRAAGTPTSVGRLRLAMSVGLHSGTIHCFLVGSPHRELIPVGREVSVVVQTEGAADTGEIAVSAATAAALPAAAVRPREDGTLVLRWRRPHASAGVPRPDREVEPETLRGLFPRLLGQVLEPGPPDPEHRVACIGFVRFSGTDELLGDAGPDAVAEALESMLRTAQRASEDEGVTLLAVDIDRDGGKLFLGSGIPRASEDDEGRMLRALRRIADADLPLPLQFGVHRGHVFAAEVGTAHRAAYSAIGDTTNTAARICAVAPPGGIYAHPAVLDHSRTLFETQSAGPFSFKGKQTPQVVYAVGSELGTRAEESLGELPLVARDEELETLERAVERAMAGEGGVITIVGEMGLGKTRLLREAISDLDPALRISLRAEPYGAISAYRVFRDPIRSLLGVERGSAAEMREALREGAARAAPGLLPWLALLGEVAHVDVEPSPEVSALAPRFRPDRLADAVIRLLAATRPGPLVVVFDDAQWSDEASAHLLGRVARECDARPWLLLVARREGEEGFTPGDDRTLFLEPLSPSASEALVTSATEAAPLRRHEVDLVVERAGGIPLFVEEIIRAAREVGTVDEVPDSLEAAMAAQVDGLDPEARRVLRYASVLGNSFRTSVLAEILRTDGHELDPAVFARMGSFLESDGETRRRFRRALIRDTTYAGLAHRLRRRLHRAAGEATERTVEDLAANADTLALHFSLAGDADRTWRYARVAADRARRAFANPDAARLYRLALEAARRLTGVTERDRLEVWIALGEVCEQGGMFQAALDAYRRGSQLVRDDPAARAELLWRRAGARERAGAFSSALRELTAAARLLEGLDTRAASKLRARISSFAATVRFGQERPREALRLALRASALARRADEPIALAQALEIAGEARVLLGGGAETDGLLEALAIVEEAGDLERVGVMRGNLGYVASQTGRWDEAISWFESSRDVSIRTGNVVDAAIVDANIAELLVKRSQLDEAQPLLQRSIRVMRATEFIEGASYAELQLARLHVERGALEEADRLLDRVAEAFASLGQAVSSLECALVQAESRLQAGRPTAALEGLDRAAAAAGEDAVLFAPQVALARARALAALGREGEAEKEVETGLASAREQGLPYEEGRLLLARAEITRLQGNRPDPSDLEAAGRILGGLGVRGGHLFDSGPS
jgi:class 3 adenylate cyclase/tetratricopeptide (TPR) repeat protein